MRLVEAYDNAFETEILALNVAPTPASRAQVRHEPKGSPSAPRPKKLPAPYKHPVPERWRPKLAALVHRLVIGDYAGLARDGFVTYTNDPSDDSIGTWIEEYPWKLVDLPEQAWAYSEHFPIDSTSWRVVLDLWTAEEGRSELSLEATVVDDGSSITTTIDGVHVM